MLEKQLDPKNGSCELTLRKACGGASAFFRFSSDGKLSFSIQLTLKIFVCMMKFVDVHKIQFLHPIIS